MKTNNEVNLSIRRRQLYNSLREAVQEYGDFVAAHGCDDDAIVVFASAGRGDVPDTLFEFTGSDDAIIDVIEANLCDDKEACLVVASAVLKSF